MVHDPSHRALTRLNAVTGAPALVLGWLVALAAGLRLSPSAAPPLDWLGHRPALLAWWALVVLAWVARVTTSALLARRPGAVAAGPRPSAEGGPSAGDVGPPGTLTEARRDPDPDDEGRTLRVGAGVLCSVATIALLTVVAPAVFGGASGADVYQRLDAFLAALPGVGAACVLGAASALYVAEELPRALLALGLRPGGSAARAAQVTSMALGATLFVLTMSIVSHFSSAAGLVSP
ncbi:MAG: hypothetical protein R3B40_11760 [Polyangiales bacterium]